MVNPDPGIGKSICKHLVPIIIYWVELLRGEHTCIEEIENTYDRMKAYLKDTHGGEYWNETLKTARRQGREITYRIEDLLDNSEYYIEGRHWMGPLSCTLKYLYNITHTCNLCSIAQEINNIQKLVPPIQVVLDKYTRTGASIVQTGRLENRLMAPVLNKFNFVGMNEPRQALLELLVDEEDGLKVIAVTGKPGAGKTTLTSQVYEDQQVKGHFNCRAWVQLEDSFTDKQMLLSLITQLYADSNRPLPEVISKMETNPLADVIIRYLEENRGRYVIVLDGASENNLERSKLEILIDALPKDNNYGRVVITTRGEKLVKELLLRDHIIKVAVATLDKFESWDLFCKRASGSDTDPFPEDTDPFPEDVKNIFSDRIYKLCDGLPLTISVLGGLLGRDFNRYDEIITQIGQRSKTSGVVTEVLQSSINEISDELKSCLLYFCIFPRNFAVAANNLIRIWCAEGFTQTEQIANEYLTNLVKRNVVQPAEVDYYEHKGKRIKSYKVHDLIHDFLQAKVEEVNFYTSASMNLPTRDYRRACRLSVPDTRDPLPSNINLSRLRSLFIFRKNVSDTIFSSLRSLRVLSLENVPITDISKEILKLTHLRYLNLCNTNITEIPRSIGNLRNLETLNLKGTYVKKLPKEMRKLKHLRHLLAYRYETLRYTEDPHRLDGVIGVEAPKGIRKLSQLVTLSVVAADDNGIFIKELANLHQLRRLGIMDLKEKDGKSLGEALQQMDSISSMSLTMKDKEKLNLVDLQLDQGAPRRLQRLYLRGELREGLQFSNLCNLVRLRLSGSQLPHEESTLTFDVLKNLPCLVDLSLIRAFNVENLLCRGGFSCLKVLDIDQFDQLVKIEIFESMPQLTKMIIRSCSCLQMMPLGIENLKKMKELHLFEMPSKFVDRLRNFHEDGERVQHIENKWFYNDGFQKEQVDSAYTDAQQSGVHETASEGTISCGYERHDGEITEE